MKVVIAPDSFKHCLPASQVATALAAGVLEVCPDAVIDICPMADGGEGTVDAVIAATGGMIRTAEVFDPLGAPIRARFGLVGSGPDAALPGSLGLAGTLSRAEGQDGSAPATGIAIIEMAAASGLALVPESRRDPTRASTFGTGQLILAAIDAGARCVIVGAGGSATVDGGCGCAQALGVTFTSAHGEEIPYGMGGGALASVAGFERATRDPRLADVDIRVACDVFSPLLGPQGAAAVYGPQKGATAETVTLLESGLAHLAEVIARQGGPNVTDLSGAGAAGGLAAGLAAFADATLAGGLDVIAGATNLSRRLRGADVCLTGEGCLDAQSAAGKTPVGVARIAGEAGVPTICIPGQLGPGAPVDGFAGIFPLAAEGISAQAAVNQVCALLQRRAAQAMRNAHCAS